MPSAPGTTDVADVCRAYGLNAVCRRVGIDPEFVERLRAAPGEALSAYDLPPDHVAALLAGDVAALYEAGVHPVLLTRLPTAGLFGVTEETYLTAIRGARLPSAHVG